MTKYYEVLYRTKKGKLSSKIFEEPNKGYMDAYYFYQQKIKECVPCDLFILETNV